MYIATSFANYVKLNVIYACKIQDIYVPAEPALNPANLMPLDAEIV
ncbi:hypothetical protein APE01nite_11650 [Acetobacter peroxydans]|uniref:Uncharacterized protein n=1 Tax=Acetobacter peroxydans TaxID=104098 RepID=A0A4Y3TUJ3_9PROT|nr:hypothetical protein APE01nite_11650 [Acetobacter peroxydans]